MSSQIQITGETKVKSLTGVLVGTTGVVSSLNIDGSLGIPQLDVNGKILVSQLPNSVMEYKGTWDASTNTPTLANGTGNQGDVYLCNVAGTVNFGAGAIAFVVGDQVIYSGSIWQRASGATGTVTSVAITETGDSLNITGSPITTSGTINIGFNGTNLQYVNGAGNLTTFPILTGYVPYTGATQDVDLGVFKLNAQSLHIKGTAGNGHLGLKHQSASATASANEVSLFADSLGDLGWLNGNLYLSKFITSGNTAARSYTFPNANGTVALTSDISYPVTSVFGRTGAVVATSGDYTTAQVTESGNLYFTDSRARLALSFAAGSGAYNSTTGVITIPTNNTQITNGSNYITLASLSASTGISYNNTTGVITNSAPDQTVALTASTGISVTGTYPNFTITNTSPSSGGTVTSVAALTIGTSGTDLSSTVATSTTTPVITLNVPTASATNRGALSSADWTTFNNKQGTITLTTTGTSGAATFSANTLNIPNYGSALSGYLPLTGGTLSNILYFSGTDATARILPSSNNTGFIGESTSRWKGFYGTDINLNGTSNVLGTITSGIWNGTAIADTYISSAATWNGKAPGGFGLGNSVINNTNANTSTLSGFYYFTTPALNSPSSYVQAITMGYSNGDFAQLGISSGNVLYFRWGTGSWNSVQTALTNPVTGTGTTNYLPKFTGASTIGDSNLINDASGNLGLGVTPSAWYSAAGYASLQVGNASLFGRNSANSELYLSANAFDNTSGNPTYITTDFATRYVQNDGVHSWLNAPSGTAGNAITFTQAMTLTASGRLLINKTNEETYQLDVNGTGRFVGNVTGTSFIHYVNSSYNATSSIYGIAYNFGASETTDAVTYSITGGSSSTTGNSFIWKTQTGGGTPTTAFTIAKTGAATFSTTTTLGITIVTNDVTTLRLNSTGGTKNWGFATTNLAASDFGIYQSNSGGGDAISSGTARLYINGSGNVLIGTTTDAGYKLDVNGTGRFTTGVTINNSNWLNFTDASAVSRNILILASDNNLYLQYKAGSNFYLRNTDGDLRLTIASGGAATFTGSVTASSFFESSDSRLKTLIQDNYQTKGIASITPKLYTKNGKVELGYYAQDFIGILDSAISKGSDDMLSLSYREVHTAKIYALEQEIKELKAKLN
jgi:hypothetical protein